MVAANLDIDPIIAAGNRLQFDDAARGDIQFLELIDDGSPALDADQAGDLAGGQVVQGDDLTLGFLEVFLTSFQVVQTFGNGILAAGEGIVPFAELAETADPFLAAAGTDLDEFDEPHQPVDDARRYGMFHFAGVFLGLGLLHIQHLG
ncbi:hypothetical protein DESC_590112 [Desulfosarcina cetonica]|nr:hypothetical protein DESC_590112 [Desulfosarcina cetonica]